MYCISVQIQPEFLTSFNKSDFLLRVRAAGRSPEIDDFLEKGQRYLQFNFFTEQPKLLWQELQMALYNNPDYSEIIKPISIVICEDESASECLLLHHFDRNEKPDQLL
ncbi:MAG: hypothetical protein V4660_19185 [Pseudomonadota bacterium]